jgi:biopolymer transport protein ExbD
MSLLSAQQEAEVMAEINITPFTDVLLVLLIIFMILAAIVTPPGFEKELANHPPSNTPQNTHPKEIDVIVNNKGVIYVDATKTDVNGIYVAIYNEMKKKGQVHVAITADVKAPYGTIVRILDAAKDAGLEDVGFVTS